jgi:glycosyltransferase involved in cell wall biosynthesis
MQYIRRLLGRKKNLYLVSSQDDWVIRWETASLAHYLGQDYGVSVHHTPKVGGQKGQLIHFTDRYSYLNDRENLYQEVHQHNHLFLTWYHGDVNDPNPDMQQVIGRLPQVRDRLQKIITPCQLSHQGLLEIGISPDQIVLIPIGIELAKFPPPSPAERQAARQRWGIPEGALCVGSFQKDGQGWEGEGLTPKRIKGPDVFLETVAELYKHYPRLFVFLTGPARGYVKTGLDKIGLPYVHHPLADYAQIADCYRALDLYLITSRGEGGPKALMESWATGVPLVSTRVGMAADLIEDGQNGTLAEVEDVAGLVAGARAMIEDPARRERYIRAGLESVKPLDWQQVARQYYDLYRPYL